MASIALHGQSFNAHVNQKSSIQLQITPELLLRLCFDPWRRPLQCCPMRFVAFRTILCAAILYGTASSSPGWDYNVHRAINQAALASLPTNFPAFVSTPAAAERIAFLAGEPDRWRNTPDLTFKHSNGPDHYIDVEELAVYGLKAETLPLFRYDFVADLALARKANPEKFPKPAADEEHTKELVGMLPWAMAEAHAKLKSSFSYLKAYQQYGGTADEISNAQANAVYAMGVMGHLFGDAGQPLHSTIHHHGWVGNNPNGYTTSRGFHGWIDGGFIERNGGLDPDSILDQVEPATVLKYGDKPVSPDDVFKVCVKFIVEQNAKVEPLYKLDKEGKLSKEPDASGEGMAFLRKQASLSAQLLANAWFTAWEQAPADQFLIDQLKKRAGKTVQKN